METSSEEVPAAPAAPTLEPEAMDAMAVQASPPKAGGVAKRAVTMLPVYTREEDHAEKKASLESFEYPVEIDGIRVISFGKVKVETGGSAEFHNPVQIYPIGYKAEIDCSSLRTLEPTFAAFVFEIVEKDGGPEFTITNKSNGQIHWAASEAMAYKKLEAISGYANGTKLSFFNLGVELAMEGLDGVLLLPEYQFHGERGYGVSYFDEEGSTTSKAAILAKDSRERRNRRREALRFMTPEEAKQITALEKKRVAEEKEQEKLSQMAEKNRKLLEKKADKARNDASKAMVKAMKDKDRKEADEARAKLKEEEKALREKQKADEKYRGGYRRSVKFEARKKRSEASMKVLDLFDQTEGGPDSDDDTTLPAGAGAGAGAGAIAVGAGNSSSTSGGMRVSKYISLDAAIAAQKSCDSVFIGDRGDANGVDKVDWNNAVEVANSLYLHKEQLNLQFPCTLEHLMDNLCAISTSKVASSRRNSQKGANSGSNNSSSSDNSGMDVVKEESVEKKKGHNAHIDLSNIISKGPTIEVGSRVQAEAEMDRMQLCIIKAMADEIHRLLDIDGASGEGLPEDSRSSAKVSFRLPLNQLTWPEIARMCLLSSAFKEMKGDNAQTTAEMIYAIKGSRMNPYRQSKNVVRHIRYRWHVRARLAAERIKHEEDPSGPGASKTATGRRVAKKASLPEYYTHHATTDISSMTDTILNNNQYPLMGTFTSEAEVSEAMEKVAADTTNYSELYRRMACVLHKLLAVPASKNFLWDLDSDSMEEYFTVIRRPVMIVNVAMHIVNKSYDDVEDPSDDKTSRDFYLETQSIFTNCYAFNTELQTLVGQGMRCSAAFSRHYEAWILNAETAPIDVCSLKFCIMSQTLLQQSNWLSCGRCAGNFCMAKLDEEYKGGHPLVVPPTPELVASTLVEWVCPCCLEDDILGDAPFNAEQPFSAFTIDENGPSAHVPWMFNGNISTEAASELKGSPSLRLTIDALKILADPTKSCVIAKVPADGYYDEEEDSERVGPKQWTSHERLVVLLALCNYMRTMTTSISKVNFLYGECEKLRTIAAQGTFREGDFMRVVKGLVGDEGTAYCRAMLDGISGAGGTGLQREMKARVFEGRCSMCKVSTYEEDQDEGEEVGEVLLCEGCNSEVHLRCAGLASVPKDEWFCHECEERNEARGAGGVLSKFNNLNSFRSVIAEEEITNYKIDRIAAEEGHKVVDQPLPVDTSFCRCAYCEMTELDVCSPIVVGQTRAEHVAFVSQQGREKATTAQGLTVTFKVDGKPLAPPSMTMPYFPYLSSWDGDDILEHSLALQSVNKESQLYVHEICAFEMFRARLGTMRHAARRQRVKVADLAICMAGAITRPLGVDDAGREYWRFPASRGLYICFGPHGNEDEVAFNRSLNRLKEKEGVPVSESNTTIPKAGSTRLWKVVTGIANIRALANMLGRSPDEVALRRKIKSYFSVMEENVGLKTNSAALSAADAKVAVASSVPVAPVLSARQLAVVAESERRIKEEADAQFEQVKKSGALDKTPVAMVMASNKGTQVEREVVIQSETVFDEAAQQPAADGEYADYSEYFQFGRKYYGIGLVNIEGKHLKPPKGEYKVTYMVHRAGLTDPLVCDCLSEPWTDGYFFFSSCVFKRSGDYTISFLVEGANAQSIEPLVFPVTVRSMMTVCGPGDALSRLIANDHMHDSSRRTLHPKLKRSVITAKAADSSDDLTAVKACVLALFAALPAGALLLEHDPKNKDTQKVKREAPRDEFVTETTGWNEELEYMWYHVVDGATTSMELMEAVLCLEYYIQRKWMTEFHSKLLNALPPPHYAMRAPTLAAVAMRVYCLDKVLLYEKVAVEPRSSRSTGPVAESSSSGRGGGRPSKASSSSAKEELSGDKHDMVDYHEEHGRVSGRKRKSINYAEVAGEDFYEQDQMKQAKARSAAESRARHHEHLSAKYKEEEEDEEEEDFDEIDFDDEIRKVGAPPYNATNDSKVRYLSILRGLYSEESLAFWEPVPEEVESYYETIRSPMDLGTILKRVRSNHIKDDSAFSDKVRLVWDNCIWFNDDATPLNVLGKRLKTKFDKMYYQLCIMEDKPKDPVVIFDAMGNLTNSATATVTATGAATGAAATATNAVVGADADPVAADTDDEEEEEEKEDDVYSNDDAKMETDDDDDE